MNAELDVEYYRKHCLQQQTELRAVLDNQDQFTQGIEMFLDQHAMLHSGKITKADTWSFADAVMADISEELIRRIPNNCEHSIVWIIWHIARIEDVTMNLLVAGTPQIFLNNNWQEQIKTTIRHTGNAMDLEEVSALSQTVDIEALRAYRRAVGLRTREIVKQLHPADLKRKVDPAQIRRVSDEGAVVEEARGVLDYWSKRDVAGLLLMPATRHNLIHLNEALKLKQRRQ